MVRVVAWEGGSRGIENFIGQILLPGEGSLKRSDFDQLKSKLTWPKFPNGMRLEQKWNRDYGCSWKCCFYWVITWKLLFIGRGFTLVELGVGRWDILGVGHEQIFGCQEKRENPVLITFCFRVIFNFILYIKGYFKVVSSKLQVTLAYYFYYKRDFSYCQTLWLLKC